MDKRTCSLPECNRPHRARGLCASHYNQTHAPNRHAKKLTPCAWCGTEALKGSGGGRKYGAVCSQECRAWLAYPACILPADHWARWYGKASEWTPPTPKPERPAFVSGICDECGNRFHRSQPRIAKPTLLQAVRPTRGKASAQGTREQLARFLPVDRSNPHMDSSRQAVQLLRCNHDRATRPGPCCADQSWRTQ